MLHYTGRVVTEVRARDEGGAKGCQFKADVLCWKQGFNPETTVMFHAYIYLHRRATTADRSHSEGFRGLAVAGAARKEARAVVLAGA